MTGEVEFYTGDTPVTVIIHLCAFTLNKSLKMLASKPNWACLTLSRQVCNNLGDILFLYKCVGLGWRGVKMLSAF